MNIFIHIANKYCPIIYKRDAASFLIPRDLS